MEKDSVNIDSFVIRFVHSGEAELRDQMRGMVTHVQSNTHCQFAEWDQVVEFIHQYVAIILPEIDARGKETVRGELNAVKK